MSDLSNDVTAIASKTEQPGKFGPSMKIIGENKKTYWVNKFNKDGTVSKAWEKMPDVGDTVQISYQGTMKPKPEGKGEYESRTVRFFDSDIGNGVANAQTPRYEPNSASQRESSEDFGRRLAVHGFLNAQIQFKGLELVSTEDIRLAIVLEDMVNLELAKPKGWAELGEKLKTGGEVGAKGIYLEAQPEEVDEDSIPF